VRGYVIETGIPGSTPESLVDPLDRLTLVRRQLSCPVATTNMAGCGCGFMTRFWIGPFPNAGSRSAPLEGV